MRPSHRQRRPKQDTARLPVGLAMLISVDADAWALTRGRRPGPEPPLPRPGAVFSTAGNLHVCAFGRASGSGLDASDRMRSRAPLGSDRHLNSARAPGFSPRHPLRRPRERQGAALQGCSGWRNLGSRRCRLRAVSRSRDVFTGGGGSNRRGRAQAQAVGGLLTSLIGNSKIRLSALCGGIITAR